MKGEKFITLNMTYRQKANTLEALLSLVKEDPRWMEEETTSRDAIDAASIWLKELNAIASALELDLFEVGSYKIAFKK